MKTAIASKYKGDKAVLDKHFGRCDSFHIYDDATGTSEIFENPAKRIQGCKGETIVNALAEKKVKRVIAGDFGSNVQQLLNTQKIQMIIKAADGVSVPELISLLKKNL